MSLRTRSPHRMRADLLIGILSVSLDLLLAAAFFGCLSITNFFLRVVNRTLATTLLTFAAMGLAMHAVYGGFDVGRKKNRPVISALASGVFFTDLVTYLQLEIMNVNANHNDHLILFGPDLLCLMLCYVIQVTLIVLFVRLGSRLYFRLTPPRSCLLILGDPSRENELRSKLDLYRQQWRVDDVARYDAPDLPGRIAAADVIFLGPVPEEVKMPLLRLCYDGRKDVMCKAEPGDILLGGARPVVVDDMAFLSMDCSKITLSQRMIKRAGDLLISFLALVLLSPLMLLIALLIRAEDGGPVIFSQSRLTLDGRPFTIRKFRTMACSDNPEDRNTPAEVDDPRITRVGAFLRRFRLDEIPQFFNVLRGDMSLVGPRPEMMSNVDRYKTSLPAFVYREKMKAGLTGYAQIEGRYDTSAEDKLMLDLMYIENFSVWLDIKLLFRTMTVLLKKDSTRGFGRSPGSDQK